MYEGELFTYTIKVANLRPGVGDSGFCEYILWAGIDHPDDTNVPKGGGPTNSQWSDTPNALGSPDSQFAETNMNDNSDVLGLSGHEWSACCRC